MVSIVKTTYYLGESKVLKQKGNIDNISDLSHCISTPINFVIII